MADAAVNGILMNCEQLQVDSAFLRNTRVVLKGRVVSVARLRRWPGQMHSVTSDKLFLQFCWKRFERYKSVVYPSLEAK